MTSKIAIKELSSGHTIGRIILSLMLLCAIPAASQAMPRKHVPKTDVAVIVDLSGTWHNAKSKPYNYRLLQNVGTALAGASRKMAKPVAVRYHIIGAESLGRPPVCRRTFRPSLLGIGRGPEVELSLPKFKTYLAETCPNGILGLSPEPLTEITAAVISAYEAGGTISKRIPRLLVILSDFKEESPTKFDLSQVDLAHTKVVLLWRTLPEDRRSPNSLSARVSEWRRLLQARGATVEAFADTVAISSLIQLEAHLVAGGRR